MYTYLLYKLVHAYNMYKKIKNNQMHKVYLC